VISNNEENDAESPVRQTQRITPKTSQLKSLIGVDSVKEEIETLTNFIKIQQARETKGLKTSSVSYHCVFTGNPGTGKTTVARIVADIYKSLGILAKGHLVETDRSGLVAEYVGQTAVKTNKIIDSALDGVLFIDEAYSLISKSENDYGKEAIATLLKRMEDNRDRLVVILAGYSAEMQQFIDSNPGLQSRFNRYIEFPDYSAEELYQVFEKNAKEFDYKISKDAEMPLKEYLTNKVANKDKNFGNARFVRNLFEKTIERQANRLSKEVHLTDEKLSEICSIDIPM
jgi:type VII secretion ATPase EccA